jgi:hypothetical protein
MKSVKSIARSLSSPPVTSHTIHIIFPSIKNSLIQSNKKASRQCAPNFFIFDRKKRKKREMRRSSKKIIGSRISDFYSISSNQF